ncbi:hypothetical protein NDU88_003728 [Pleurodeles waltl]|uniref:Uncharacterized protein n=1 Tax=Pleurodeles waltl TaxID=8319 RepID=A0AAV7SGR5_PLEWA|nr:hypothetical protein NDU88_003728 [Pleurodeles waltl]
MLPPSRRVIGIKMVLTSTYQVIKGLTRCIQSTDPKPVSERVRCGAVVGASPELTVATQCPPCGPDSRPDAGFAVALLARRRLCYRTPQQRRIDHSGFKYNKKQHKDVWHSGQTLHHWLGSEAPVKMLLDGMMITGQYTLLVVKTYKVDIKMLI